jgi:hypothetical protein
VASPLSKSKSITSKSSPLEALVLRGMAIRGLEGKCYELMTGLRLQPREDADSRRVWEELLRETEWALPDRDPPE